MTGEDVAGEDEDSADADDPGTGSSESRRSRPLLAGAVGLLAGLAGGVAATTIAPGNLFLTLLLVVVVIVGVTGGTLRLLARRAESAD